MIPPKLEGESYQVKITFGCFASREEALRLIRELKDREDYVSSKIKGSWH